MRLFQAACLLGYAVATDPFSLIPVPIENGNDLISEKHRNRGFFNPVMFKVNNNQENIPVKNSQLPEMLQNQDFINLMSDTIAHHESHENYGIFFESKPIYAETMADDYEFVLVSTTVFDRFPQNNHTFKPYWLTIMAGETDHTYKGHTQDISGYDKRTFIFTKPNKSGSLVIPVPELDDQENVIGSHYQNLKSFLNHADQEAIYSFWATWSSALSDWYAEVLDGSKNKVCLSTAGSGVFFLHGRLDTRPKYYRFVPYHDEGGDEYEKVYPSKVNQPDQ